MTGLVLAAFAIYCALWPLILGYRYDRTFEVLPVPILLNGLLVMAVSFFMPTNSNDPRSIFMHLSTAFYFLPFMAMGALEDRDISESAIFAASMIAIALLSKIKIKINSQPLLGMSSIFIASIACGVGLILCFVYFVGFGVFNLNIERVYDFRGDSYDNLPIIARYIQMFYLYFLAPASCLIAYYRREWVYGLVSFVLFIAVMGFSNVKFPLAMLFFLFIVFVSRKRGATLLWMLLTAIILLLALDQLRDLQTESRLFDLLLRRGAISRAINTFAHFDLFHELRYVWWRDSKITLGLFGSTYGVTVPYLVGEYLGYPKMAANAGWVAAGFSQGGVVGVGIYSVIIAMTLSAGQNIVRSAPVLAICYGVLAASMFSEADVSTSLLTGGVLPALFLALFCNEMKGVIAQGRSGPRANGPFPTPRGRLPIRR